MLTLLKIIDVLTSHAIARSLKIFCEEKERFCFFLASKKCGANT